MNKLQNRMTAYTDQPQQQATWETHVVIPLAQNAIGGGAAAILTGLGLRWFMFFPFDMTMDFAMFVGFGSFSLISILRFFADDLGIIPAAYKAGQYMMQKQNDALVAENERLRAQLASVRPHNQRVITDVDKRQQAYAHAKQLLQIAHESGIANISRTKVQSWCPQRAWERATGLMRRAGVLTNNDMLAASTLAGSYKLLDAQWATEKQRGSNYVAG